MVSQEPAKLSWLNNQSGFESRSLRHICGGRIVDECAGLENRRPARVRGFESHPPRHTLDAGIAFLVVW